MPSPSTSCRVVVLVSGRGSNLEAIAQATRTGALPIDLVAVISNRAQAPALDIARRYGIATDVVEHTGFAERADFDRALARQIDLHRPNVVALAGFMRVLGQEFIDHYAGRLINIHPSLLPAFPGLHTHERALASGAKQHGATVHFVTRDVDGGPIIAQAAVPVLPGDTPATLAARVLAEEHRIYPQALRWFAEGRLALDGACAMLDGIPVSAAEFRPRSGKTDGLARWERLLRLGYTLLNRRKL